VTKIGGWNTGPVEWDGVRRTTAARWRVLVDIYCPQAEGRRCGVIGRVWHVQDWHRTENVATSSGHEMRRAAVEDGFVLTSTWHDDSRRRRQRRAPIAVAEPVSAGRSLMVWCPEHGAYWQDSSALEAWAEAASRHGKRGHRQAVATGPPQ
jgi:hypothetical protein